MLGLVVVFVLLAAFGVRGCHPPRDPADSGSAYTPPEGPSGPTSFRGGPGPESELDPLNISVVMTDRILQETYEGTVVARLAPDGRSFVLSSTFQRGGRKYYGFQVCDLRGEVLWEHVFPVSAYRRADAFYLAGGRYIGAVACDYDQEGEVQIRAADGQLVFTRPIVGWTMPVMSARGSWLALFNQQRNTLSVFGPPRFETAWSLKLGEGAHGFFLEDGPRFLLIESGRARLFGAGGQVLWSVAIPGGGYWRALASPDGRYVAATTEDPDSAVYLYSAEDGSLVWSQSLVTGGHKSLAFSPDGASLVVYDIGQHAAIYMLDAAGGNIVWRFYLTAYGRTGSMITVKDLQFTPDGRYIVADIVESTLDDRTYVMYHYLLALAPDGHALWITPLGSQVDVEMNAVAGLLLIMTNNVTDGYGLIRNTLTLVTFLEDLTSPQ
ncbi:MAG: PQQ-binding-like beta-propeller repeat protein [Bacillota bacterium]